MQVRPWLILCRLKKQEKGEGSSGVRDSRLAGVEREVLGPHGKQCFVVCAPWVARVDCLHGRLRRELGGVVEEPWSTIPRIHSGMQRTGWKGRRIHPCGLS